MTPMKKKPRMKKKPPRTRKLHKLRKQQKKIEQQRKLLEKTAFLKDHQQEVSALAALSLEENQVEQQRELLEKTAFLKDHQQEVSALAALSLEELLCQITDQQCHQWLGEAALRVKVKELSRPLSREELNAVLEHPTCPVLKQLIIEELRARKQDCKKCMAAKPKRPRTEPEPKPKATSSSQVTRWRAERQRISPVAPEKAASDWWRERGE
jgi:hypothetical protein